MWNFLVCAFRTGPGATWFSKQVGVIWDAWPIIGYHAASADILQWAGFADIRQWSDLYLHNSADRIYAHDGWDARRQFQGRSASQ